MSLVSIDAKERALLYEVLDQADALMRVMDQHSLAEARGGSYRGDPAVVKQAQRVHNAVETVHNWQARSAEKQISASFRRRQVKQPRAGWVQRLVYKMSGGSRGKARMGPLEYCCQLLACGLCFADYEEWRVHRHTFEKKQFRNQEEETK